MTKLYELSGAIKDLQSAVSESDAHELAITETLDLVEMDFNDKAIAIVKMVTNINADYVTPLDNEIKRLQERKKAFQKRQERIKEYLRYNMAASGINKIECAEFTITLKKPAKVVNISDEAKIPDELMTVKTDIKPNKAEIARVLKAGGEVDGCELVDGNPGLMIK